MKFLPTIITVAVLGSGVLMADNSNGQKGSGADNGQHTQMHKGFGKGHKKNFIKKMMKELDLTDDQKSKLKAIRAEQRSMRKAQRLGHKGEASPVNFISSDGFDKDGFISAAKAKAEMRAEIRGEMFTKIFAVLTPEQRVQLSKKISAKK